MAGAVVARILLALGLIFAVAAPAGAQQRRAVDVSVDGRANDGVPLHAARDRALDRGVTVNGLAILNELPHLDRYVRKYLIGGAGSFVMVARDYDDFAAAMTRKLLREIDSAPLARRQAPRQTRLTALP